MYDLIIIGASAAGVSAAIYASRRRLNFKIITQDFGGEVATSGEIENWPGIIYTTGVELAEKFKEQLKANQVIVEEGKWVEKISKQGDFFIVDGSSDGLKFQEKAKTVLIATGVHPKELNIPGEKEFRAKGLSYCSVCDGPLFPNQTVAVIGGGNSALESALMMSAIASKVYLINKNPKFKGEEILISKVAQSQNVEIIYETLTSKILGDKFVTGLEYKDKSNQTHQLQASGVFVHIGRVPNNSFLEEVDLNEIGEIKIDRFGRTNLAGLYAAGDVTDLPHNQIVIAAGQGVTALLSIVDYLNKNG